jgi:hypothetical protein
MFCCIPCLTIRIYAITFTCDEGLLFCHDVRADGSRQLGAMRPWSFSHSKTFKQKAFLAISIALVECVRTKERRGGAFRALPFQAFKSRSQHTLTGVPTPRYGLYLHHVLLILLNSPRTHAFRLRLASAAQNPALSPPIFSAVCILPRSLS